jgi:hypothetical protein
MKKLSIVFAACVALAGCLSPPPVPQHVSVSLTPEQITKIQQGVRASMADPASADFGAIYGGRYDANTVGICGYVSGRNRLGGMTGLVPFRGALMGNGPSQTYQNHAIAAGDEVAIATIQVCRRAGIMPGG